jgi:hypothetical protein
MQSVAKADDFTLRIYVTPPEELTDETLPTRPFQKDASTKRIVERERRVALARKRIAWARRLLIRFQFGLPETR